ncbi:hypothetical protein Tco_0928986 [Tanacetum coccineum]
MILKKKVNTKPTNYAELNRLSKDFGKRFVPQRELSDEQALHPSTDQSASSFVKIEAPHELPKVSLVNTSLKKLKYHLGQFDNVVKKRITPNALTKGEWGIEHTKTVFQKEIIPFLKTLKDIFNVFDKDLLNEVTEVQTVFNQMEVVVQQYYVDKQCFEIQKKHFLIENDRLLDQIISQDIVNIVLNSSVDVNTSVKVNSSIIMNDSMNYVEMCNKCLEFEAELIKQHNMLNKEIFQKNNTFVNQNEPSFDQFFELNNLKAELQEKDTTIKKLKTNIKRAKALCSVCNECLFDANHVMCLIDHVNSMNVRAKSACKKNKKKEEWKPTGKVFNSVGYKWKPTGRTFTLVGNACPLTRITATNNVPLRVPIPLEVAAPKQVVTRVYTRRPKIVQMVLWYLDFGCFKHMTGDRSQLTNFVHKFLGTVKFGNDQVAKIMGYGDYQIGNVTISKVYYVEGLRHNLFLVGQFCDSDLEVAFRKHTCFVCNLEGVDLLLGSQGTNLYSLSIEDMMASSPICLLSKATKTKS